MADECFDWSSQNLLDPARLIRRLSMGLTGSAPGTYVPDIDMRTTLAQKV